MRRFHVHSTSSDENLFCLSESESHHALTVLRLKRGDLLELIDGKGGHFSGILSEIRDGQVWVMKNRNLVSASESEADVSLAVSVIKPERMDTLIEKSCELGVRALFPVLSARSVIKLSKERWEAKLARWQKIIRESCKQCGRSFFPEMTPVTSFETFIRTLPEYDQILIPTLAVPNRPLSETLKRGPGLRSLVLIGPEGDFTEKEVSLACKKGAIPVSLGSSVLRAETAAFYVLSALHFFYQRSSKGQS